MNPHRTELPIGYAVGAFALSAYATFTIFVISHGRGKRLGAPELNWIWANGNLLTMAVILIHIVTLTALRTKFRRLAIWESAICSALLAPLWLAGAYQLLSALSIPWLVVACGAGVLSVLLVYGIMELARRRN